MYVVFSLRLLLSSNAYVFCEQNNLTTTLVVILLDTFLFLFFLVRSLLKGKRTRSILEKIKAVIGVAFRGDDDDVETDWIYSEGGGGAKNFNLDSYEAV